MEKIQADWGGGARCVAIPPLFARCSIELQCPVILSASTVLVSPFLLKPLRTLRQACEEICASRPDLAEELLELCCPVKGPPALPQAPPALLKQDRMVPLVPSGGTEELRAIDANPITFGASADDLGRPRCKETGERLPACRPKSRQAT